MFNLSTKLYGACYEGYDLLRINHPLDTQEFDDLFEDLLSYHHGWSVISH